ncbi:hypothetical protein SRB5_53080 [Streptomyces sp. RB5]|uniref:Uncharacterized protein n=1 Tax=Streptomyces smaragdinus TaxID=2585196 RepID=A0A7K0CNR9_9ACTN|nr:hypothetical protein [Streptomyces smaragdinus]MQY15130.1 hypothetical protein [Streptomyces smaragdinus]
MIRAGRTWADDAQAANMMGWKSVRTFRNKKAWKDLTPALISRPDARTRIYDLERLKALLRADAQLPQIPDEDHADDLLDVVEAWEAMPPDQRPTLATWRSYLSIGTGPTPDDEPAGAPHFHRRTALTWLDGRERHPGAGGRPKGSADKKPRDLSHDRRHLLAESRRARIAAFLEEQPKPTGTDMTALAAELQVTLRHVERLVAEARTA